MAENKERKNSKAKKIGLGIVAVVAIAGIIAGAAVGGVYGMYAANHHTTKKAVTPAKPSVYATTVNNSNSDENGKGTQWIELTDDGANAKVVNNNGEQSTNVATLNANVENANDAKITYQWYLLSNKAWTNVENNEDNVIKNVFNGDIANFLNSIGATINVGVNANLEIDVNSSYFNINAVNYYACLVTINGTQYLTNTITVIPFAEFTAATTLATQPLTSAVLTQKWNALQAKGLNNDEFIASIFAFLYNLNKTGSVAVTNFGSNSLTFTYLAKGASNTDTYTLSFAENGNSICQMSVGGVNENSAYAGLTLNVVSATSTNNQSGDTNPIRTSEAVDNLTKLYADSMTDIYYNGSVLTWETSNENGDSLTIPYLSANNYLGQVSTADYNITTNSVTAQNVSQYSSGDVTFNIELNKLFNFSKGTNWADLTKVIYNWTSGDGTAISGSNGSFTNSFSTSSISLTQTINTTKITSATFDLNLTIVYINGFTQVLTVPATVNVIAPTLSIDLTNTATLNGKSINVLNENQTNYNVNFNINVTNTTNANGTNSTFYVFSNDNPTFDSTWLRANALSLNLTNNALTQNDWAEIWAYLTRELRLTNIASIEFVYAETFNLGDTETTIYSNINSFGVTNAETSVSATQTINNVNENEIDVTQYDLTTLDLKVSGVAMTVKNLYGYEQVVSASDAQIVEYNWTVNGNTVSSTNSYLYNVNVSTAGKYTVECTIMMRWNGLTVSQTFTFTINVTANNATLTNLSGPTTLYLDQTANIPTYTLTNNLTGWTLTGINWTVGSLTYAGNTDNWALTASDLSALTAKTGTLTLKAEATFVGDGQTITKTATLTITVLADDLPNLSATTLVSTQKVGLNATGNLTLTVPISNKNILTIGKTAYDLSAYTITWNWVGVSDTTASYSVDLANISSAVGSHTYSVNMTLTSPHGYTKTYVLEFVINVVDENFNFTVIQKASDLTTTDGTDVYIVGQTTALPTFNIKSQLLAQGLGNIGGDWYATYSLIAVNNGKSYPLANQAKQALTFGDTINITAVGDDFAGLIAGTYTLTLTVQVFSYDAKTGYTAVGKLITETNAATFIIARSPTVTLNLPATYKTQQYFGSLSTLTAPTLTYDFGKLELNKFTAAETIKYSWTDASGKTQTANSFDVSNWAYMLQKADTYIINVSASWSYNGVTIAKTGKITIVVAPTTMILGVSPTNYNLLGTGTSGAVMQMNNTLQYTLNSTVWAYNGKTVDNFITYAWTITGPNNQSYSVGNNTSFTLNSFDKLANLAAGTYTVTLTATYNNGTFSVSANSGDNFTFTITDVAVSGVSYTSTGPYVYIQGQSNDFSTISVSAGTVTAGKTTLSPSYSWSYNDKLLGNGYFNGSESGLELDESAVKEINFGSISTYAKLSANATITYSNNSYYNNTVYVNLPNIDVYLVNSNWYTGLWTITNPTSQSSYSYTLGQEYSNINAGGTIGLDAPKGTDLSWLTPTFTQNSVAWTIKNTTNDIGMMMMTTFNPNDFSALFSIGDYTINAYITITDNYGIESSISQNFSFDVTGSSLITLTNPSTGYLPNNSAAYIITSSPTITSTVSINGLSVNSSNWNANLSYNITATVNNATLTATLDASNNGDITIPLTDLKADGNSVLIITVNLVYASANGEPQNISTQINTVYLYYSPDSTIAQNEANQTFNDNLLGLQPTPDATSSPLYDWYYFVNNTKSINTITKANYNDWHPVPSTYDLSTSKGLLDFLNSLDAKGESVSLIAVTSYTGVEPYYLGQSNLVTISGVYSSAYLSGLFANATLNGYGYGILIGNSNFNFKYNVDTTLPSGLTLQAYGDAASLANNILTVTGNASSLNLTDGQIKNDIVPTLEVLEGKNVLATVSLPEYIFLAYFESEKTMARDLVNYSSVFAHSNMLAYAQNPTAQNSDLTLSFGINSSINWTNTNTATNITNAAGSLQETFEISDNHNLIYSQLFSGQTQYLNDIDGVNGNDITLNGNYAYPNYFEFGINFSNANDQYWSIFSSTGNINYTYYPYSYNVYINSMAANDPNYVLNYNGAEYLNSGSVSSVYSNDNLNGYNPAQSLYTSSFIPVNTVFYSTNNTNIYSSPSSSSSTGTEIYNNSQDVQGMISSTYLNKDVYLAEDIDGIEYFTTPFLVINTSPLEYTPSTSQEGLSIWTQQYDTSSSFFDYYNDAADDFDLQIWPNYNQFSTWANSISTTALYFGYMLNIQYTTINLSNNTQSEGLVINENESIMTGNLYETLTNPGFYFMNAVINTDDTYNDFIPGMSNVIYWSSTQDTNGTSLASLYNAGGLANISWADNGVGTNWIESNAPKNADKTFADQFNLYFGQAQYYNVTPYNETAVTINYLPMLNLTSWNDQNIGLYLGNDFNYVSDNLIVAAAPIINSVNNFYQFIGQADYSSPTYYTKLGTISNNNSVDNYFFTATESEPYRGGGGSAS